MTTGPDPAQAREATGEMGDGSQRRVLETTPDSTASDVDVSGPAPARAVNVGLSPPDWSELETVVYI